MKKLIIVFICVGISLFYYVNLGISQEPISDLKIQFAKEPGIIVDVRTEEEWAEGHYSKAIHSDWDAGVFKKQAPSWDKNKTYYLHCAAGGRSQSAADFLKKLGFKKVYNLGGYDRLKNLK